MSGSNFRKYRGSLTGCKFEEISRQKFDEVWREQFDEIKR